MLKKILVGILISSMLIGGFAFSEDLSDYFIAERFITVINDSLPGLIGSQGIALSDDDRTRMAGYFSLEESERTENVIYYDNTDWKVEATFYYEDGAANAQTPAAIMNFIVDEHLEDADLAVALSMFACGLYKCDASIDIEEIVAWLNVSENTGDSIQLPNGYRISLVHDVGKYIYAILPDDEPVQSAATPTPKATHAPTPGPADAPENYCTLFSWNGFTMELDRVEPMICNDGSVYLYFYTVVTNTSDRTVSMHIEDARVNSYAVGGVGQTDIAPGEVLEDRFFFLPLEGNEDEIRALCSAESAAFTIVLMDRDTYEILARERIAVDTLNQPSATPEQMITQQPEPDYPTLSKGDIGEEVEMLQQRLIELGYLNDAADGDFGNRTATAVREFCKANGLTVSDIATSEIQEVLYGSDAVAYSEPYIPLTMPYGSYGQWDKADNDKLKIHVEVTNASKDKTVKAFEVYMYATDVWGERLYGATTVYYATTTRNIGPGETVYCDYMYLPNRSQIDRVYVAVSKVVFTDGTIREAADLDYANWTITW